MIAVYPGSFDPVTNGHIDIIQRAAKLTDTLYVAVLTNPSKKPFFTVEERISLLEKVTEDIPNVKIEPFSGLLIDYAEKIGAKIIFRGLRAVSDYEYELQMALANKKLKGDTETLFMVANSKYSFLSSSLVKEIATFGGDLTGMVPDFVISEVEAKIKRR
ncbi:phosphopantetheine adenylyltransferase [Ezakiella coagulans]|uniref:Phosphopantetheine adenylyltransferase n=1 Tax=Ezakiella coagulans TaxID=46507 RepID=A0A2U1E3U6_9FIRM|nr:pantetheine-phosphate adenylyltransferase [Ezakiella coagulans]KGF08046.1 phosphopantetheine adenylyltransferase [Tissierellia bacterium S7-1-4]PVY94601.1 phosphopantetheine adenylyltransferase [Ezakiella coagulans]UQK60642.1 pantetheine-phosphate adenylyltransferase [Ezakiella coagulans]